MGEINGSEGGSAMSDKLNTVLTWAERIASAIKIAVPAIRGIVSLFETSTVEAALIPGDED